jgi:hypothetical protein
MAEGTTTTALNGPQIVISGEAVCSSSTMIGDAR